MLRSREESLSKKTMPEFRLRLKSGGKPPNKKKRKEKEEQELRIREQQQGLQESRGERPNVSILLCSAAGGRETREAPQEAVVQQLCVQAPPAPQKRRKGPLEKTCSQLYEPFGEEGKEALKGFPCQGPSAGQGWICLGAGALSGQPDSSPFIAGSASTGAARGMEEARLAASVLVTGRDGSLPLRGRDSTPPLHGRGMDSRHGRRVPSTRPDVPVNASISSHKQTRVGTNGATPSRQGRSEGGEPAAPRRAEGFTPPPPPPPEEDDQDRYNIQEATQEEVAAQAQRDAAQEEDSYNKQLWDQAIRTAMQDPGRPRSARELVREGKLRDWWSMSWKDCRALVDNDLQEMYLKKLQELFAEQGSEEGGVCTRGSRIILQPTQCSALHGRLPRNATHNGYGAGGAWRNVSRRHSRRRIPDVRLLSQGHLCGTFHREHPPEHSKGGLQGKGHRAIGQIIATFEGQTEGGMSYLSTSCTDAGSARLGRSLAAQPGLRCATGNLDTVASLREILTPMSTARKTRVFRWALKGQLADACLGWTDLLCDCH